MKKTNLFGLKLHCSLAIFLLVLLPRLTKADCDTCQHTVTSDHGPYEYVIYTPYVPQCGPPDSSSAHCKFTVWIKVSWQYYQYINGQWTTGDTGQAQNRDCEDVSGCGG